MATMNFPEGGINVRPDVNAEVSRFEAGIRMAQLRMGEWLNNPLSPPHFSAAEIHAHLDTEADAEVQRAERILEYRKLYPGNAFLTRDQVRNLCQKYNLVFAPMFAFAGEIPERNREEIERFGLHEKHQELQLSTTDAAGFSRIEHGGPFVATVELSDNPGAPWAIPVTSNFGLYLPKGWYDFRIFASEVMRSYWPRDWGKDGVIPAIPVMLTNSGWYKFDPRQIRMLGLDMERQIDDSIQFRWTRDTPKATWQMRVAFEVMGVPSFRLAATQWTANVADMEQMVICPPDMLHENLPLTVSNRWEVQFSTQRDVRGVGADPIVLQPVSGGFLVVTKWDAEANLPEVAGQTN